MPSISTFPSVTRARQVAHIGDADGLQRLGLHREQRRGAGGSGAGGHGEFHRAVGLAVVADLGRDEGQVHRRRGRIGREARRRLRDGREGIADGVDAHGALRLLEPGGVHTVISGEVSVRPA